MTSQWRLDYFCILILVLRNRSHQENLAIPISHSQILLKIPEVLFSQGPGFTLMI